MDMVDPLTRLSANFILADFLGCQSVYAKGYPNFLANDEQKHAKLLNLQALCNEALEPILNQWGSLSISYGYISPSLSCKIVTYQDPNKPSHHRADLGAAADVCLHAWVQGTCTHADDLYLPESARGSPIALAFGIDAAQIPYSRIITYSESPYLCIAVSAAEVGRDQPRKAFYENRYTGKPKVKPEYIQLSSESARRRHLQTIQEQGLDIPWQGAGYPTYHGGGYRQYHHMRVSKYSMVSDWLFDLQSVANGAKNVPSLDMGSVQDSFAAAGIVYDWMLRTFSIPRLSIVSGYVSHLNPYFDLENDWRNTQASFAVVLPAHMSASTFCDLCLRLPNGAYVSLLSDTCVRVHFDVDMTLADPSWDL